jgi:hypothetical protein
VVLRVRGQNVLDQKSAVRANGAVGRAFAVDVRLAVAVGCAPRGRRGRIAVLAGVNRLVAVRFGRFRLAAFYAALHLGVL